MYVLATPDKQTVLGEVGALRGVPIPVERIKIGRPVGNLGGANLYNEMAARSELRESHHMVDEFRRSLVAFHYTGDPQNPVGKYAFGGVGELRPRDEAATPFPETPTAAPTPVTANPLGDAIAAYLKKNLRIRVDANWDGTSQEWIEIEAELFLNGERISKDSTLIQIHG